jgi:hypothetical protein
MSTQGQRHDECITLKISIFRSLMQNSTTAETGKVELEKGRKKAEYMDD